MVMVRLKGLHTVKSGGRTYYYAWRGGPRIEGDPGTPGFHAAWMEAKNPLAAYDKKNFGTWVRQYKASAEFKALSPRTKYNWSIWCDRIIDEFGSLSLKQFDRPTIRVDIRRWRDKWRDKPRTADYAKQVLSRVLSYCMSEGVLGLNACIGVKNIYRSNRAEIIWEQDDIDKLCASAGPEIGHALRLACLTGLRQGDLLRLSWSHIDALAIEMRTAKSGERLVAQIPLYGELRALLATIPRRSTRVLTNSHGQPWKAFGSSWDKAMEASGLKAKGLHFHDARGTAATRFYCAGFSTREIARIMAWDEAYVRDMIDRYVKKDELINAQIRRLEKFTPEG